MASIIVAAAAMRPHHPSVHVELGLRRRRAFPGRIVVHGQLDPSEQGSPHKASEVLDLSFRVRPLVAADITPSDQSYRDGSASRTISISPSHSVLPAGLLDRAACYLSL